MCLYWKTDLSAGSKYVGQKLIEVENKINESISTMDTLRPLYQQCTDLGDRLINEDTVELNTTNYRLDIIDIYWLFHRTTAEHTFFSYSQETLAKIDHNLGHKIYLNKSERLEII